MMNKEVVIITKYFVPYKVVDSDSVYQMIVKLKQLDKNLKIHVVTTDSAYKSEIVDYDMYDAEILKNIKIHQIKNVKSKGKSSIKKFGEGLVEGYRLVATASKLEIDNIISLTNPPLIAMWCSLLLKKKNYFYWSFDLYPDALAADHILSPKSLLYKLFDKLTYLNSPQGLIALGDFQYNYLCKKFRTKISPVILPCGVHNDEIVNKHNLPNWADDNKIILGYIGNIGRAHSLSFLKNVISVVKNQSTVKLVLCVYGFYASEIFEHVKQVNANNVILVDFIEKKYLNLIDVNLVSLKDSWTNVSVPSKAVSAICSGSTIWFCGAQDSDTWGMFNSCGYKSSDKLQDIKDTFSKITPIDILKKRERALIIKEELIAKEDLAYKTILQSLR